MACEVVMDYSIPCHVHSFYLDVGKLKEFLIFSFHEEDAGPIYSHSKPASGQRRACGQEANVSGAKTRVDSSFISTPTSK